MKAAKRACKYTAIFLLMTVMLLLFSGCWNYREIDSLSIVAGFAIDKGQQGYKYRCTFELVDLSQSGGKQGGAKSKLIETDGDSIFDCARNAVEKSKNRLYFSDCKIIVISKALAAEGIHPIMDWMMRDAEVRITLNPFISKQDTAKEILSQKAVTDNIVSYEIASMLKNSASVLAKSVSVQMYEAQNMLEGEGVSMVLPVLAVEQSGDNKTLKLEGTAVFKRDRLTGFLGSQDTQFLLFVKNLVKGGLLLTDLDSGSDMTLEIFGSKTKVEPVISGDTVSMNINVDLQTGIAEDQTKTGYVSEKGIKKVEEAAAQTLQKNITDLIKRVQQQYGSDIFGFGNLVYQNNYKYWEKSGANWEQTFKNLECNVNAKVKITATALEKSNNKVGD